MIGLLIAPLGIVGNLLDKATVRESHMLMALCLGMAVFLLGRLVQGPGA
jgi:hypothetical protein